MKHPKIPRPFLAAAALLLAAAPASLPAADKPAPEPPPSAEFLGQLDPQMREVVDAVVASGALPLYQLDPAKARKQPTPTDAAMVVA